ncbi:hypothetical protein M9Y10_008159 [Tritrichomonas musculus]|uniref:EF-hand domain-containing protein n=1 Tax=Tritrichomonas musculus TaxID=1915356 RepID=A0ABR2IYA8_9EUKA
MSDLALEVEYADNPLSGLFGKMTEIVGGNVARRSFIKLSSTSSSIKNALPGIVDPTWNDFLITGSKNDHHIRFDFKSRKIDISRYSVRTGPKPKNIDHLKSWKLEGSNDGKNFVLLDKQENSSQLNGKQNVFVSEPIKCQEPYRYIQLTMIGKNWSGHRQLFLQKIEFFGKIYGDSYKGELSKAIEQDEDIEKFRSLFNIIDTNGNGQLEPDELTQFFVKVFPLPLKMVPLAFRICDSDNNGSIDFDEFKQFFGKLSSLKSSNPLPAYHMLFDALDSNNDGYLILPEFVEFAALVQIDITPEEARALIKLSGHSQGVNFDDIYRSCLDPTASYTSYAPRQYSNEEIENLRQEFNRLDKDGNGELDREELQHFVGDQDPEQAAIVADRVFLLCDFDKSGTISFDEYIEFCNMLVALTADEQKFFEKIFYALDKEHVGSLDYDNLVQFYRLASCDMSDEEVRNQIASKDDDKDGRLTFSQAIDI